MYIDMNITSKTIFHLRRKWKKKQYVKNESILTTQDASQSFPSFRRINGLKEKTRDTSSRLTIYFTHNIIRYSVDKRIVF